MRMRGTRGSERRENNAGLLSFIAHWFVREVKSLKGV